MSADLTRNHTQIDFKGGGDETRGLRASCRHMPVLGALFRSRDFQNDETELVVVATAYLVKPGKERDYASPGDGFVPPADVETIMLGRLNAMYKNDPQGLKSAGAAKTGFIVE